MYRQEITGKHRTAIVIAVDHSLSMSEMMMCVDGKLRPKVEIVRNSVNDIIYELLERARRDGHVRDYYDIAVVGYSGRGIRNLLGGERFFVPVPALEGLVKRRFVERVEVVTGDGGRLAVRDRERVVWIDPEAEGETPMFEAFSAICRELEVWCDDIRNAVSFPPVVINITDGEATDCTAGELRFIAGRIRRLGTSDGRVLLMNIHITNSETCRPLLFPTRDEVDSENRFASLLADCSSDMPEPFNAAVRECRRTFAEPPYVAMGYNTSMIELLTMLDIGSRSVNYLR